MRQFHGLIFMGAGERTEAECAFLTKRLQEAMMLVSGMQQAHEGTFESEVEDIVRDIAAAVLGREVTFGEKLPYPGKHVEIPE